MPAPVECLVLLDSGGVAECSVKHIERGVNRAC
jgi:hypothetical protein